MVTATGIRNALLESVVNPTTDPLIRKVIAIGTPDYLRLKAVEILTVDYGFSEDSEKLSALEEAITLLAIAKAQLTPPPAKKPRSRASTKQGVA